MINNISPEPRLEPFWELLVKGLGGLRTLLGVVGEAFEMYWKALRDVQVMCGGTCLDYFKDNLGMFKISL